MTPDGKTPDDKTPDTDPAPAVSPEDQKRSRRMKMIASLLLVGAAAAFWGASRLVWCEVFAEDGLAPQRRFDVRGADWSPWLTPLALVYLAAVAAALTVRGWGLKLIAALVAIGGVVAAIPAISLATEGANSEYAVNAGEIPDRYQVVAVIANGWVAAVVLLGTALSVAGAVMLLRVGKVGAAPSKYQTPAARREDLEREIFRNHERKRAVAAGELSEDEADDGSSSNERIMWDALDTGLDPTEVPGDDADAPGSGETGAGSTPKRPE